MIYNSTIRGLVTRDSSTKRTRSPHRRAGLTKLRVPVVAAPKWQPSLSPFTYEGFCVFAATRQGASANGPAWAAPKNTGTRNLRDCAAQPVREGLHKVCGQSGDKQPAYRMNRGVMRTLSLFCPSISLLIDQHEKAGSGQIPKVSPLPELWSFEG